MRSDELDDLARLLARFAKVRVIVAEAEVMERRVPVCCEGNTSNISAIAKANQAEILASRRQWSDEGSYIGGMITNGRTIV